MEIVVGYPIWLSQSCKLITAKGKTRVGRGLIASQNKELSLIEEAQNQLLQNLEKYLKSSDNYNLCKTSELTDLIKKMLDKDPMKRISPKEVLEHKFIT